MAASIDDLIATVTAMSVQFTAVLDAINVQKSYIDNAGNVAAGSVTAAAASAASAAGSATAAATSASSAAQTAANVAGALSDAQTAADQALAALATIGTSLTAAQTAATNAATSAATATTKATAAAGSATAAAASAASITGAEANSAASASAALVSQNAAGTSATNAAASAAAALVSQNAAAGSATAAGGSAMAAAASATSSETSNQASLTSANNATTAKNTAVSSASAASTSATAAAGSASAAATSETNAAASASTATTKASQASASASAASTSETNAAASATEAEYWAGQAHAGQAQADWNETDNTQVDFIKNKPTLGTASALNVPAGGNAAAGEVVKGSDTRLSDARAIALTGVANGQVPRWSGTSWVVGAYGTSADLDVPASGNATAGQVVKGSDTRLSDARAIALTGAIAGQTPRWSGTAWIVGSYGTAAELDVPASGDATTGQVVKGSDTRLTNARAIALTGTVNGQVPLWNGSAWVVGAITPGLSNFTESLNTSTPNATVAVAQLLANVSTTNGDAVFSPKGTGAILANVPDNTTAGGNKRGANAVDLQTLRTSNQRVAAGVGSVIVGGRNNYVTGLYSGTLVGDTNQVRSDYSVVVGGSGNNISITSYEHAFIGGGAGNNINAAYGSIVGGSGNGAGYLSSVGGGNANGANGSSASIAGGSFNSLDGDYSSCPGGIGGIDRAVKGALVWGGATGSSGNRQKGDYLLAALTANATATILTTDNQTPDVTNQLNMPDNSTYYVTLRITARNMGNGAAASWTGTALFNRLSGVGTIVRVGGAVTASFVTSGLTLAVPTITADTTLGVIKVTVVGIASTNIQWLCHLDTIETTA